MKSILKLSSIAVVLLMTISSLSVIAPTAPQDDEPQEASISALTSHAPIAINYNSGFLGPNTSTGITTGSGTMADPYVIEGWEINASSGYGIFISNSRVMKIVRDLMYGRITRGQYIEKLKAIAVDCGLKGWYESQGYPLDEKCRLSRKGMKVI